VIRPPFRAFDRSALDSAVGIWVSPWVWGGYGGRNSVPTAALAVDRRHGVP